MFSKELAGGLSKVSWNNVFIKQQKKLVCKEFLKKSSEKQNRSFTTMFPTIISLFSSNLSRSKSKLNSRATKYKKNKNKAQKLPFDILWYSLHAKIISAFIEEILHFQSSKKNYRYIIIFKPACLCLMLKCIATSSTCQADVNIWLWHIDVCLKPQPELPHIDTDGSEEEYWSA